MNMLDMHTRENVNRLHVAEMHQDARIRRLLRDLNPTKSMDSSAGRARLFLIVLVLAVLVSAFLVPKL